MNRTPQDVPIPLALETHATSTQDLHEHTQRPTRTRGNARAGADRVEPRGDPESSGSGEFTCPWDAGCHALCVSCAQEQRGDDACAHARALRAADIAGWTCIDCGASVVAFGARVPRPDAFDFVADLGFAQQYARSGAAADAEARRIYADLARKFIYGT